MPKFTNKECIYFYLMGAGTGYLSSDTFLDEYGFGPMKKRKKAAVVVDGYVDKSSQWLKFIESVDATYDTLKAKFKAESKETAAKKAREGVAAALKRKGTGPGLFVEMFVPESHGSHFFGMRSDGIIANGYPDSVFNSALDLSGVGLGLGFQEDASHGFCQTFAIMWLLISQTTQSVKVNPAWFPPGRGSKKTRWEKQCNRWHNKIWKKLKDSEKNKSVIDINNEINALRKRGNDPRVSDFEVDKLLIRIKELEKERKKLRDPIYLDNAALALSFLAEFTQYCDFYYTVDEVMEMCASVDVVGCPKFNKARMKRFLNALVKSSGGPKGTVKLHSIFSYLNSQGRPLLEKWFED